MLSALQNHPEVIHAVAIASQLKTDVYLVGGAVRDCVLGRQDIEDIDIVVTRAYEEFVRELTTALKGKAIPWDFDQSRIFFKESDAWRHIDVAQCKGPDIVSDLEKRDFTINAMAVDLQAFLKDQSFVILDPLHGQRDIKEKRVALCGRTSFTDDPLRMLRAIRIARQTGFSISPDTFGVIKNQAHLLKNTAVERIKKELFTVLALPNVCDSIDELYASGVLSQLVPIVDGFTAIEQSEPHQFSLLEHSIKTVASVEDVIVSVSEASPIGSYLDEPLEEGVTRKALLMFIALMHDSGKCKTQKNCSGRITFHGHDSVGAEINGEAAKNCGLGKRCRKIVQCVTKQHMRVLQLSMLETITERAKNRLISDCPDCFIETALLAVADSKATSDAREYDNEAARITTLVNDLLSLYYSMRDETDAAPAVSGNDVISILGLSEGPEVGRILRDLYELECTGRISSREEALEWLKQQK